MGLAAALVAMCGWALRRGFDITDEGFHLLNYAYPAEYSSSFSSFHLLISQVLPAQQVSVVGYRAASLLMALFSASVFSWAFRRWSAARFGAALPVAWVWPLFIICSLVQYAVFPRTINYNTLNSLAIAIFGSAVLNYLAAPGRRALALLGLGGLVMGLDGFVKLSSSAAALGSGALVLVLSAPGGFGRPAARHSLLVLGAGALLAIGGFGLFVKPLPAWYHDFHHETEVLLSTSYNSGLLARYVRDAFPTIQTLLFPFGAVAAVAGAWVYYRGRGLNRLGQHLAVVAGVALVLGLEGYRTGLYKNTHFNGHRSASWPLGCLLVGAAMLVAARQRYVGPLWLRGNWRPWLVPLWLLVLPLAAAVGTGNNIFINVQLEEMYWLAALLVLYQSLPAPVQPLRAVRLALVALPALVLAEQTAYGLLWKPYLQVENMFQQQTPLTVGPPPHPTRLLVDAPSARYLQALRAALHRAGFRPGGPLLALYDAPGLVYAVGGVSPGNAWYFSGIDTRNSDALAKTHLDLGRAFLLVNEKPGAGLFASLAARGLHFPADYQLVHQAISPYSRSPYQWRSQQDTLQVYAPRPRAGSFRAPPTPVD
ncbi:hypothetical protein GCM10022409_33840 [Hymenobacter glaciei]|uniref:Glycosyltransferase RgtA/B/C/D-like domain-containing protein n=1 Tax=Hymenobacter glaciei TaxID=877209 RepID=A0ABP7UJD2_9BACT